MKNVGESIYFVTFWYKRDVKNKRIKQIINSSMGWIKLSVSEKRINNCKRLIMTHDDRKVIEKLSMFLLSITY